MTKGQLVNRDVDEISVRRTQPFYDRKLIPAEKKPFLIDLRRCAGPLLAVDNGQYILDVASQIASLGLGFNAGAMFGAAQFLESWTGNDKTPAIRQVRIAFEQLMQRTLDWPELHLQLCNSGAEANETALGMCFHQRSNQDAKKVIAFEGAFHGRMMISLAATWNEKKREPFRWPGYETSFAPYPEMDGDDVLAAEIPKGWQANWAAANPRDTSQDLANVLRSQFNADDPLLQAEIDSLLRVRELLASQQHYAILVEPMQCEGGDRYSSARFHQGLINLAQAFQVPLIYDEIQTGFGLGGDFFWHRKFDLRDANGDPIYPDHVVVAKKAQVGAVMSRQTCPFVEQYNPTSLIRGCIHASMIDQFREEIDRIEQRSRTELQELIQRFGPAISRPRVSGMCFAFDFADPGTLKQFVANRFLHGLLYYPAGDRAARFRFNLAFRGELLDIAWQQIHAALSATLNPGDEPSAISFVGPNVDSYFDFHQRFISAKLKGLNAQPPLSGGADEFLRSALEQLGLDADVVFLTPSNWQNYRQQVWDMQTLIYEPLRQTEIKKFDQLIAADNSIAFALLQNERIIAMAFAAPPINFPDERGVPDDDYFEDPKTVYMLDLTVVPEHQGRLGRVIKQALCLAAQSKGLQAVQGRNRDRLARGMWAINLSLGSYCTRILKDDYVDEYPFRDCLMYRCGLDWQDEPICLSNGVHQPLEASDLSEEFCFRNLPAVPNKLTLSNFVTADYLDQLDRVFALLPAEWRHGYSASGMSECVDKLVKTIWLKRKPRQRLVRIGDSFFGHGSFMSRSLSGISDALFPVTTIPNDPRLLDSLERQLIGDEVLAVFVEPLGCLSGVRIEPETLCQLSTLCQKHQTPLVTHDSAGLFHRYDTEAFLPTAMDGFQPDAGMIFLGGQMSVCFMREAFFEETPLMFISTWDGDLLSLAQFNHALDNAKNLPELMGRFHEALTNKLANQGITDMAMRGGAGWFRGRLNEEMACMFRQPETDRFISCPSVGAIKKFLAWLEE